MRLRRAAQFQTNLTARLRLLAELHWATPRPPSDVDLAFRHSELPSMEASASKLWDDVAGLRARASELMRSVRSVEQAAGEAGPQVPPAQLRRVRDALAEHDRAIRAAMRRVTELGDALSGAEAEAGMAAPLPLPPSGLLTY
jgi:hypothetical protein